MATDENQELNNYQRFLLKWLAKADYSAYGECRGPALDVLIKRSYAIVVDKLTGSPQDDYARVALTPAGIKEANRCV